MTERTPRVWNEGDPQPPADVKAVRSSLNGIVFERVGTTFVQWRATRESQGDEHLYRWYDVAIGPENAAPLTEVLPSPSTYGRYCPNTMQPADECECIECTPPTPESVQDAPTAGVPSQDPGNATEALRALADVLDSALDRNAPNPDAIQGWDFDEDLIPIANAILAAGWRPPLPADEVEWGIRVRGETDVETGSEDWARAVAERHEGYEVVRRTSWRVVQ